MPNWSCARRAIKPSRSSHARVSHEAVGDLAAAADTKVADVTTSNKQLNFLQHIMTVLAPNGGAAVVQRLDATTVDHLLQQSRDLAAAKPNRQAVGIAVAEASALRKIALDQKLSQAVFLLPDGSADDPGHAVIRFHPTIRGGLRSKVRKAIIDEFRKNLVRA